ncbi:MAG TPA: FliH/SctL family protein [Clostridia bacterium]
MSNSIFKNYQINMGIPVQIRPSLNYEAISQRIPELNDDVDSRKKEKEAMEIVEKARQDAELIIKEAQYEADRIIEQAQSDSIIISEEARLKGYQEGMNEAGRKYEQLLSEAEELKEKMKAEYYEILSGIESDVLDMILDISRKVIGNEIKVNPENILLLIKHAFEKCSNASGAVLRLSPVDYEYVINHRESLDSIDGADEIEIKKDSSLKTGGCIIETDYGTLDASVETKLSKIEKELKNMV